MNILKELADLPPGMKSRGALLFRIGYKFVLLAKRNAATVFQVGMMIVDTDDGLISLCSEDNNPDLFNTYGTLILGRYNDESYQAVFTGATASDKQRVRKVFVFFQGESGNYLLLVDNELIHSGCYQLDYGPIYDEDAYSSNQKRSRLIISLLDRK